MDANPRGAAMATMTIKNVPDDLYDLLKWSAERHRRSMNSEAIACLELALRSERLDPEATLRRAREIRRQTAALFVTDAELRAGREEGRP
jgi:plasmid stability protein